MLLEPKKSGRLANFVMLIIIAALAILLGYFYNKSRQTAKEGNTPLSSSATTSVEEATTTTTVAGATTTTTAIMAGKDFWAKMPAKPKEIYVIQKGDTLFPIAQKFSLTWETLAAANSITEPDKIKIDQALVIPKMDDKTKLPYVEFSQNADVLAKAPEGKRDDPAAIAKVELGPIFSIASGDEFTAKTQDKTATVSIVRKVEGKTYNYAVSLIKPSQAGWENAWIIEKVTAQ